jgi:hypothetical protein
LVRVLEQPGPDTDGWAAVAISVGKQTDTYLLHTIPTDLGDGALTFEVEKLDADMAAVETYHVHLSDSRADRSCDCKGHARHGRCKHREGIETLVAKGKLPRSTSAQAKNDPAAFEADQAAIAGTFTPNPAHGIEGQDSYPAA